MTEWESKALWLVADIGGTNARFALYPAGSLAEGDALYHTRMATASVAGPATAIARVLEEAGCPTPAAAALAIAAPVANHSADTQISLTNARWRFTPRAVQAELGLERLEVVNDFAALAHALPLLTDGDRSPLGPALSPRPGRPILVLGPGTGLGAAAIVADRHGGWTVVPGEAGHMTAAACTAEEAEVLDHLRHERGHVSYERLASGPGLVEIAGALAALRRAPTPPDTPAEVVAAARAGDRLCGDAIVLFQNWLATLVGDLALAFGALGGVYLAGGVLSHLEGLLDAEAFRRRLEDKGRFSDYLAQVPLWRLTRPDTAFLGLRRLLSEAPEPDELKKT
ncbi:glucokinase [Aquibaculum arenosum]|uniref:Glucokinase n=1 Tax=Aquibaculum arenosum TaxID=3032591 RepID=A0ABT5YMA1_9PROT|nr:glucokinase [Fodinicurvata sp. CAU 1616]MDF2095890.1 glucokinase [Fodinicurvata sp. CAU 1616]